MAKKRIYLANFNITFGEDDAPMLTQFENIILPAFTSTEHVKGRYDKDSFFFFEDVRMKEYEKFGYALVGNIIKKTKVEFKSDHVDGRLVMKNEVHSNAPYSRFILFLKNHRLALIKNEKESPTLKNLQHTFEKNAKKIIKLHNDKLKDNPDKTLRYPGIVANVISLPLEEDVKEVFSRIDSIQKFSLRFFPLNGDIDMSEFVQNNRKMMEHMGSKSGNVAFNSPQSKKVVADTIDTSSGLVECSVDAKMKDGSKSKIKSNQFNASMECDIIENNITEDSDNNIIESISSNEGIKKVSPENQSIYDLFKDKLIKLMGMFNKE